MKIFLHSLALTVVILSALLPAVSAFAYSEQSPADPAAVFVPEADPLLEPYWHCLSSPTGAEACPVDSTPIMLIESSGTAPGALGSYQIICTTVDCPTLAYYVYVKIAWEHIYRVTIAGTQYNFSLAINTITNYSSVSYSYSETIECPTGLGLQTCKYDLYLPIKKAQVSDWNGAPVRVNINSYQAGGNNIQSTNRQLITAIELSFIAPSCDERFTVIEPIADYDIDETLEIPLGPDAVSPDLPDNQKIEMLGGNIYRLETDGGPWRSTASSTKDLYTTEVSFDEGATWLELEEIDYICIEAKVPEPDLKIIYFMAPPGTQYFMIRVLQDQQQDWSDNWLTNPASPMHYKVDLSAEFTSACSQAFTFGEEDLLISGTIPSTADQGIAVNIPFPPETINSATGMPLDFPWIVIETGPTGWYDAAPDVRYDALGRWASLPTSTFLIGEQEEPTGLLECVEAINGGGYRVFIQSPNDAYLNLKVNDQDANYANNNGNLDYRIYLATYTRPSEACESTFAVGNDRNSSSVSATAQNGKSIGVLKYASTAVFQNNELAIGGWYAIDTDSGPWLGPGTTHSNSYSLQISTGTIAGPLVWEDLDAWADATCIVPLDNIGHIRVYFQVPLDLMGAPDGARAYYLRVDDTDFSSNQGSMGYTIWKVTEVAVPPDGNGVCSSYGYDLNTTTASISINANSSNGTPADPTQLLPDVYYMLLVDGGPWFEGLASPELYSIEISTNDGETWSPALIHPQVLCAEENGNEYRIFIKPGAGEVWRFRVMSNSFGDNLGGQHISIHPANPDGEIVGTCLEGASLYEMASYIVDAKREDGIIVPLVIGEVYAIEISSGYWRDNAILGPLSPQYYALDMSVDNGTTWELFHEHSRLDCFKWITRPLLLGSMGRFKPDTGETIRFRVANSAAETDQNWANNGGGVTIKVYAVTDADDSEIDEIPDLTGLGDACMDMAIRPTSVLDLAGWVMYGFDTFRLYIAWCPRHNAALAAIFSLFGQYEPFATIEAFIQFYNTTKTELNSYNWTNSAVQGSAIGTNNNLTLAAAESMLSPKGAASPWVSGHITIRDTSTASFSTSCNSTLKPYIGNQMSDSYCFAGNMMRAVGVNVWFQLLVDIMAIVAVVIYIVFRIIKPAMT
jgi:hypothetical protein